MKIIAQTLGLAFTLASVSAPAFAHSQTEAYTPADGSTVSEVEEIAMAFDKPMRVIAVTLVLEGNEVAIEREVGMDPVTAFRAIPEQALTPGDYTVEWRGMSVDGHPMQGTFAFNVAP